MTAVGSPEKAERAILGMTLAAGWAFLWPIQVEHICGRAKTPYSLARTF